MRHDRGFTLIELLVVIMIIGILAAIAVPLFVANMSLARGSSVQSSIANVKVELVSAIVDGGALPTGADLAALLSSHEGDGVTLTVTGDADGFCVEGSHSDVSGSTWASGWRTGVVTDASCTGAGVIVMP